MWLSPRSFLLLLAFSCAAQVGWAADAEAQSDGAQQPVQAAPAPSDSLTIATRHAPPFAYKDASGQWSGIAVELWNRIAARNGYDFQYTELGLTEMLDAVAAGRIDAAVAALTITADREAQFDFSHAFHTSGLAIAVPQRSSTVFSVLSRFMSREFLTIVAGLLALLVTVGVLIWLVERRANPQFRRKAWSGIGAGLWWSAVTMTTVGYGDKVPMTFWGRVLGMVWMFAALIVISTFTAAITTALTVNELDASLNGIDDLRSKRVLVLQGSTSDSFLADERIRHRTVGTLAEALEQLAAGQADAVVHDAPILRYEISVAFRRHLRVLPFTLTRQDYGIALPAGSKIREPVNVALLEIIGSDDWPGILADYLGTER
ncbi:periplasmic component of amino acid ABC-type transporter/signal transduction system [Thioflavicoccus mobilis 8321]|uniref:Periplasmic component of amino acid ABC-type transporter/signal transduction system n=1 Tax=Thioflavicoccus mobilis 8321 TaxID=765912 RepID=L0GV51_9GAMM|nr:periplasmic component of amino acid ABC-type transporter/signal transduction system [Thioflavicoccus mobilis 8321]